MISAWLWLTEELMSWRRACLRAPIRVTDRLMGSVGLPEKCPVGVSVGGSLPAGCMVSDTRD
jgi:hypothetical protein